MNAVRFHPEAEAEMLEAARYYEAQHGLINLVLICGKIGLAVGCRFCFIMLRFLARFR